MTQRRHLTLVAAGETLLSTMPLATVFEQWTWLVGVLIVVGGMTGVAVGLRSLRAPAWVPTLGMIGVYVLALTWLYGEGAIFGVIPGPSTFTGFNDLLLQAGNTIRGSGVPVGDDNGLLFLAALGIGAMFLAIDLAAVVARRPALAGIPMAAVYLVAVGTHSDSVNVLPFICTAAAFLWLLVTDNVDRIRRFGRRFSGDGRDVDMYEPSPLAAAGRRLAAVGLAFAVILPIAVPGMTTGLLDRFGSGIGDGNGPGNGNGNGSVNLFSLLAGSLVRDRAFDMVKVTTTDPNPFYLRIGVADDVTAAGFVNRSAWGPGQALNNVPQPAVPSGVASHAYRADVEIVNFNERMLPIFSEPTKFERLDNSWLWDRRSSVLYSVRSNSRNKKYSFNFVRMEYSPEGLRGAGPLPNDNPVRQQYTRVPQLKSIQDQANNLTRDKATQYDKVRAIYDFFSPTNDFKYSLTTAPGNSGSAIVDFLNNKVGYCEQYAAAMAWLVRAAGIPARVAIGFTRGGTRAGNTYTLNNFNLHAWTEVYFDGFGWVPFDATPPASISGAVSTSWAPDPSQPTGPVFGEAPDDLTPSGGSASGPAGIDEAQFGPNDPTADGGTDSGGGLVGWPLYIGIGVVVLLVLLLLPMLRRSTLRRRRQGDRAPVVAAARGPDVDTGGPPLGIPSRQARHEAHAAWDELVDTMIDFKVPVDPAETPRLTAERLVRERDLDLDAADGARLLSRAEERARYAREPMRGAALGTSLRQIRAALRESVSPRTRLLATLLPPSVLLRWRATWTARYVRAATVAGRRRDQVIRKANPRRLISTGRKKD